MRSITAVVSLGIVTFGLAAQGADTAAAGTAAGAAPAAAQATDDLKQQIEILKQAVAALERKLEAQDKKQQDVKPEAPQAQQVSVKELASEVQELDQRVSATEKGQSLDRLRFSGDYRFEAHTIGGNIPAHYDGMEMQNLLVKTMFTMGVLGQPPSSVDQINRTVASNYGGYQQFTNNLTFDRLKQSMAQFPAPMQQQLFGMLMPYARVPRYSANNDILYTNRLRLRFDTKVAENVTFTGRLAMYKVFGDSTGVQVFNGQPNTLSTDGTTAGVPNSDQLRVERAYLSWNRIGGSKLYLSVGRRPSTEGPPMNFRNDDLRGGTPSGSLIDYQFDGITVGYNLSDNMVWRLCYGLGYESGFGNGQLLKSPQDRLKDVHFLGANLDLWTTEKSLVQFTFAHAFDVTDGFSGLMVLPRNPLTGDPISGPAVLRYTPSANLGGIHLLGVTLTRRAKAFDLYFSGNMSATRPNLKTTPFGGLMSDPFDTPENREGFMLLGGARYNFGNDERTKLGFEMNHGSRYWFNFAQSADDIIAPKTNTRGDVYETYLTHRISDRFILKADLIRYVYRYSGSGWHVGLPKRLDQMPMLGFPTYDGATKFAISLITRF